MVSLKHRMGGWRALVVAVAFGCRAEPPVLERVHPARVLNDRTIALTLVGKHLDAVVEERDGVLVETPWTVEIADRVHLARRISTEQIEVSLGPGLLPGSHDVVARASDRSAVLRSGLTAVAPVGPRLDATEPDRISLAGGVLRLAGAGLFQGTQVRIDGSEAAVRWVSDQELEITTPPGEPGPASVEATTPVGRAIREDLIRYEVR